MIFVYSGQNIFGKDKVINRLLKEQEINKALAVYIGDETRDVEAAQKLGMKVIAVTWGFNSKKVLQTLNPDAIVEKPQDLIRWFDKYV